MIADRVHFQPVYDLTERVLPYWADMTETTVAERDRFWAERGARALCVWFPGHNGTRIRHIVVKSYLPGFRYQTGKRIDRKHRRSAARFYGLPRGWRIADRPK